LTIRDDLERDGYCVARNVFTETEIDRLRLLVEAGVARSDRQHPGHPTLVPTQHIAVGDLLAQPELAPFDFVVFNDKLLAVVRQLLGDKIVYFGDSSMQTGEGTRGFHKDSVHRNDPAGSDWTSRYDLVRFGLYLQDHSRHSGGLKVRQGSHRVASDSTGRAVNIDSRIGDLVLWKLTTSHSGNVVRPLLLPGLCLHPGIENRLPRALRVAEQRTRMSLFGTFAAPGMHFETYLDYIGKRSDFHAHYAHCSFPEQARATAAARGIELRVPMPQFGTQVNAEAS
jgi:hypothetical protein